MNFLALDTSSNACSVALQIDDKIAQRHVVEAKVHTRILMPSIEALLQEYGIESTDLDAIFLGNGPGSFIGIRIGASVAQGIAFGAGIDIVPVSSLAVVAIEAFSRSSVDKVTVLQDARMGEVYSAVYQRGDEDMPILLGEETIVSISDTAPVSEAQGMAGSAWDDIPALRECHATSSATRIGVRYPNAQFLLKLGAQAYFQEQAVPPATLTPAYLRHQVAEPDRSMAAADPQLGE